MGSPYDIGSIMQYGGYSFSKNGKPTIVVKYVEFLPLLGGFTSTTIVGTDIHWSYAATKVALLFINTRDVAHCGFATNELSRDWFKCALFRVRTTVQSTKNSFILFDILNMQPVRNVS